MRGLTLIFTGHGKGKTTAALGMLFRAWGHGLRLCVIQFIKSEKGRWGETMAAEKLGIEWHTLGKGFTWRAQDMAQAAEKAREGWALAQVKIASGSYDLIILDEFTYLMKFGWLEAAAVVEWLRQNKPDALHLVITGRDAAPELIEYADLVTEMTKVKHPFDAGVRGQRGVEF
jgi:cob(I)alamin adenosyltransferase